jgi:hypothetical protein
MKETASVKDLLEDVDDTVSLVIEI